MTTYIKTQDAETARATAKATLKGMNETIKKSARHFVTLSIALADIVADADDQTHDGVKAELKLLTISVGEETYPTDETAAKKLARDLDKHSYACVKTCLLLIGEKGFFSGYRHADTQDYVTKETYDAMNTQTKATHHQELFWERDKTFPRDKNATGNPVASSSEKVIPTQQQVLDAYALHFSTRELNESKDGLKPTTKTTSTENLPFLKSDSPAKDVWKIADNLGNWLDDDNLLSIDTDESEGKKSGNGSTLKRLNELAEKIEKAIDRNATAIRDADQQEQREMDKKSSIAKTG